MTTAKSEVSSEYVRSANPKGGRDAQQVSESTRFVNTREEAVRTVISQIDGAKQELLGIGSKDALNLTFQFMPYREAILSASIRTKGEGRYITDVTKSNLDACKFLRDSHITVRHLSGIKSNLLISESEFTSDLTPSHPGEPSVKILYSNSKELLAQQRQLFETLWSISTPAEQKIREIEEGVEAEQTEIIRGVKETTARIMEFFSKAKQVMSICATYSGPSVSIGVEAYRSAFIKMNRRGLRIRYITEITKENIIFSKELMKLVELKHLDGIKGNFALSENEYTSTTAEMRSGELIPQMLYSNSKSTVEQQTYLFDLLWATAVDAEMKIREIEEGIEPEETKVIDKYSKVEEIADYIARTTKSEVLVLLPTLERLELSRDVFEVLKQRVSRDKIKVRILSPFSSDMKDFERIIKHFSMFEIRRIEPIKLGLLISDQARLLFIQYSDIQSPDLGKSIASGIYATHKQTISSITSIYETMWASSEVREKETKSRNQAELLQDILTHDIRNYNQVARLSAELLSEEIKDNVPVQSITESMLKAIDGSTNLLERAKKLGKVLSEENPELHRVDLKEVIHASMSLVKDSYRDRSIEFSEKWISKPPGIVSADDLLEEAFTNLLSNTVKYTESDPVQIEISFEKMDGGDPAMIETSGPSSTFQACWIISISDYARGIPDELKPKLFRRYLESAKGSGLGMSIVHALVVERYKGAVRVLNRVPHDYSKGTTVQIWLPKG